MTKQKGGWHAASLHSAQGLLFSGLLCTVPLSIAYTRYGRVYSTACPSPGSKRTYVLAGRESAYACAKQYVAAGWFRAGMGETNEWLEERERQRKDKKKNRKQVRGWHLPGQTMSFD